MSSNNMNYVVEFVGTFFFLSVILMATGGGNPKANLGNVAPLAIGIALIAAICMGGAVSGGHYNPAVSVMMYLNKSLPMQDLLPYIGAQLVGGLAAMQFAQMTLPSVVNAMSNVGRK